MNKYLLLFILPFLSFVMVGCNDNEDDVVFAPKLELLVELGKSLTKATRRFLKETAYLI